MRPAFVGTTRFELVRRIGVGGMGVVYEAIDREHDRRVAVKTLLGANPSWLRMFKREFRALTDLQHPNLVSLYELMSEGEQLFFTMELVRGVDFLQWVRPGDARTASRRDGDAAEGATLKLCSPGRAPATTTGAPDWSAVDEPRLRGAVVQLARGVAALHAAGKVHRDIKPSNVLVSTSDGRVVLLDFGVIADLDSSARRSAIVGTPHYMAPEQAAGAEVGPAADAYSVGVVLYQALTGRLPLSGAPQTVLELKQRVEPQPPRAICPAVPADLDELCAALLRIDPSRRATIPDLLRHLHATADAARPGGEGRPQFVGRATELEALRQCFDSVRSGESTQVVVHGESGVGKSALLARFVDWLRSSTPIAPLVLWGRCYERETLPFKALDGIVDQLSEEIVAEPIDDLGVSDRDLAVSARVFGVLRGLASDPPETFDPAQRAHYPVRLARTLAQLVRRVAHGRPVVIFVDDIHWADRQSMELLELLLRLLRRDSVLLVMTSRPPVPLAESALPAQEIVLSPLPHACATELAEELLRRAGGDVAAAERIAREADGHPLFVDELVRGHVEGGLARHRLPLEEALWLRIGKCDERSRRVLAVLALSREPLPQHVVASAAGIHLRDFADCSNALRGARLVRTAGSGRSDFIDAFHDRTRQAVLIHLSADEQRRGHRALAAALESVEAAEHDVEQLLFHWRAAGDGERAAHYALIAADRANDAFAFQRAVELYRAVIELSPSRAATARVRLAEALVNLGRGAEAAPLFIAAAGAGGEDATELHRRAAEAYLHSGHIHEGIALLSASLEEVGIALPRSRAGALESLVRHRALVRLRRLGHIVTNRKPAPRAVQRIDRAWSAATGLTDVDYIRAADLHAQHLLLALDGGDRDRIVRALAFEAMFAAATGTPARRRVEHVLSAMERAAAGVSAPHVEGVMRGAHGVVAFLFGSWTEARAQLEQATNVLGRGCRGVNWESRTLEQYWLSVLCYLGDFARLRIELPRRLSDALDRGDMLMATRLRTSLMNQTWLAQDDHERARHEAREAIERWSYQGFHLQHYFDMLAEGHIDLYRQDDDPLRAHRRVQQSWAALRESRLLSVQIVRIEALHLRARGALAGAGAEPALFRRATLDARRIAAENVPWANALAQLIDAAVAARRGRTVEAIDGLAAAESGFRATATRAHAASARRRRGELIGGDEGRQLIDEADAELAQAGIVRPARFAAMLAPGF